MWLKWLPWRFMVRSVAKKHGFLDPMTLFSRLERFAQPSEVAAPVELLRSGAVIHARGLINSQAIQHNLDWVWPYWVECQFNPHDKAFIPRAFSITHINLTHRNWTAVGVPGMKYYPIVDPRGLITPFFDGWSVDAWIIPEEGEPLIPSRMSSSRQELSLDKNISVQTETELNRMKLRTNIFVDKGDGGNICHIELKGYSHHKGWLAISLRPYNPEGISFIHDINILPDKKGWKVNKDKLVCFDTEPEQQILSSYHDGDVYACLQNFPILKSDKIVCDVGMATAVALFELSPAKSREIEIQIPLEENDIFAPRGEYVRKSKRTTHWKESLNDTCKVNLPDKHFQFLYDAAVRTLILHSPKEVYPGPYTYRRFWFRDAAFILEAMLSVGLSDRVKRVIDIFPGRQTPLGYFRSQEGEWDSNGEALWAIQRYCELTNKMPDVLWQKPIHKGGLWISRKRIFSQRDDLHAGLFPAGFSAEHLVD